MKIPKYIDRLLEKRARSADIFRSCDSQIVAWLEKNNIIVDDGDIMTGAISICEPYTSISNIRMCIEKHNKTTV